MIGFSRIRHVITDCLRGCLILLSLAILGFMAFHRYKDQEPRSFDPFARNKIPANPAAASDSNEDP
jgi:hypothetical protein